MPDPETWPFPTTTTIAARLGRLAYGEGLHHPWTRPMRPRDCDAYEQELGREPSAAEWTRFSIVFDRALLAMESAPDGAELWDDNRERFVHGGQDVLLVEPSRDTSRVQLQHINPHAEAGAIEGLGWHSDAPTGKADR